MIIPDASVVVELLTNGALADSIRRLVAGQRIDPHRSKQFLAALAALPAYDATYIALAEATNSVLYTCDEKLRARVVLFIC